MRHYLAALLAVAYIPMFAAQAEFPAQPDTTYNTQENLFFGLAAAAQSPIAGAAVPSLAVTKSATGVEVGTGALFGGLDIALSSIGSQNSRVYILGSSQKIPGSVDFTRVGIAAMTQCEGSIDQSFNAAGNLITSDGSGDQVLRPGYLAFAYLATDIDDNPASNQIPQRIAIDGNGRLGVVSNWSDDDPEGFEDSPAVLLINANGTLDTTVNQDGAFAFNILQGLNDNFEEADKRSPHGVVLSAIVNAVGDGVEANPIDIAFSSNNLPTVAGSTEAQLGVGNTLPKIYLYRLDNDGFLDETFNSQGDNLQDISGDFDIASNLDDGAGALFYSRGFDDGEVVGLIPARLKRANNGGYFVAGSFVAANGTRYALITKLTSTGLIDTSFGSAGSNAFQANGTQISDMRFKGMGSGSVVVTLGTDANPITDAFDFKELSDGSVVVIGQTLTTLGGLPDTFANGFVVKLTASGALDSSFNASGSVLTYNGQNLAPGTTAPGILLFSTSPDATVNTLAQSVCCATDGKIFVSGTRVIGGNLTQAFFVLGLNANGTPDTSFNPSNVEVTYAGQLANNATLEQTTGSAFANYLGIYNVALVDNGEFFKCETNSSNNIFIGGPNVDEYLFAFKLRGPGRFVPCPAASGSFVCALIDKYSQFCSSDCPQI